MYQSIVLIGNVGNDPEMRLTNSGVPVTSFSMAVNKTWTKDGQKQSKSTWFRISVWRGQAEAVATYLKKGSKVMVVGEIEEARAFTDKSGNNRASLEVTASLVKFLDGKDNGDASGAHEMAAAALSDDGHEIPF